MNNITAIAKLNDDFRANPSLGTFVCIKIGKFRREYLFGAKTG